jgi:hypothetical protein
MCFSTYYKYGCALLHKAQAKIAPYHEDLVEGSASRDDTGSAKASGSNVRKGIRHYLFTSCNHIHHYFGYNSFSYYSLIETLFLGCVMLLPMLLPL